MINKKGILGKFNLEVVHKTVRSKEILEGGMKDNTYFQ